MTSSAIRQAFLDFFKNKGHEIVPSAPIVVKNDPTLMFTNAGMNQFKELFLGEAPIKFPRVVDTQRCLRVSGKHNDLEEVGIDTYHHTMFEMLGNWSFGDYFKKEAIAWSWELLTEVYKIDKDRLYVTVFEGDEQEGLPADTEAYDCWKMHINPDRILKGNKKDNFWEMGETGPCGPSSEIHIDCRSEAERQAVDGANLVNADHPQVIEIWNNVFMQFNRLKDGSLQPLPAKHVDTGMGFERLVRVLQHKTSNYDTDVFQPLINVIAQEANVVYGAQESQDIAMRVMADHVRAIAFAIADGQLPSNNKAGYVIRRILRRAVRYAYTFLNFKEPFLHKLVPVLAAQFEGVFNELFAQQDFVQKVVLEEEASFLRTLITGIQRFEGYHADENKVVNGDFAFELYDTYGFPIDLTALMAREKGWDIDMKGFEKALDEQKQRSRAATTIDTGDWVVLDEHTDTTFEGYDTLQTNTKLLKYRKISVKGRDQYQLTLANTPFYAEGGGQVGDTGTLTDEQTGEVIDIRDTKKENGLIIHFTDKLPTHLRGVFLAKVNTERRAAIERNHSATHLLHAALKTVLGAHVNQKGSLVNDEVLRFDFSHFAKVNEEEITRIEHLVNQKIRENIFLQEQRSVPYAEALASGVTALFGEKYGDYVRVITFDDHFSKELCGGTHVGNTGNIGYFKIVGESAVAAGVRRIEAITGTKADDFIQEQGKLLQQLKDMLKNPKDLSIALHALLQENQKLKKEVEKLTQEKAHQLKDTLINHAEVVNGVRMILDMVELPSADAVKSLAFSIKQSVPKDLCLVLAANIEGKPHVAVMIADNLVKERNLDAGKLVRELAKEIKGGGGGQAFFATAGGKDVNGLPIVLQKAKALLS
ncbi:alanine--tRNA ligase [Olivibacter ginsenosidimutans]|uniref:Alanine--tRNA ligase n=1 Tax=Olivibacter ginsenosidimutans TaxID=1176537 RepID=A0ABP9B4C7_9SPHI